MLERLKGFWPLQNCNENIVEAKPLPNENSMTRLPPYEIEEHKHEMQDPDVRRKNQSVKYVQKLLPV